VVPQDRTTWELIGERYLDTQHDAAYVAQLEAELAARGVLGLRRVLYEYVAASALWWNFLWWDWVRLDCRDVRLGWISNAVLFAFAATLAWILLGAVAGIVCVLILHGLTLWMGLGLRAGSIATDKE